MWPRSRWRKLVYIAALLGVPAGFLVLLSQSAFRRTVVYPTEFNSDEQERLKRALGDWLPRGANIDWAMLYHSRDTDYYFRAHVSEVVADLFRQRVESAGTVDHDYDPRWLAPDAESSPPAITAAFGLNQREVDFIIFGKPDNGLVPIYFEAMVKDYPVRSDLRISDIFVRAR